MILHDHRITMWFFVHHGANARGYYLLRRRQLGWRGWRGWLRRWHGGRRAGVIDKTYDQRLLAFDRRRRQLLRLGLHLVPQHQCEQHVQYQYQRQHESQRPVRQRWLSPTLATQGLTRFAVQ